MHCVSRSFRHRRALVLAIVPLAFLFLQALSCVQGSNGVVEALGPGYYVDSVSGSDANPGTSADRPWRTFAPVHARTFLPGDTIYLKCGSSWSTGLVIDDSGVEGNPITFRSYGTGAKPSITNTGGKRAVDIRADWIVVDGLRVHSVSDGGVYIAAGSDHNVVSNCEATGTGIGISVHGQHNLITRNYLHDLRMVVNTPGGNDDYGAVGVWLYNSNNEVSYNRFVNCIAPSYDYGQDGGAVEWFGTVDNCYVHHNWAEGCKGFLEIGGGSARNTRVAYNVSINNGRFSWLNVTGSYGSAIDRFSIENNTIVETSYQNPYGWVVFGFNAPPPPNAFILRNNIVYVDNFWFVCDADREGWSIVHEGNVYFLANQASKLGFSLGYKEKLADPLLANLAGRDLRLQSASPAIDAGLNLGAGLDFDGCIVPYGAGTDVGAYEYGAPKATATPTHTPLPPTATPTKAPTLIATPTRLPTQPPTSAPPTATPTQAPTQSPTPVLPTATPSPSPRDVVVDDTSSKFATRSVDAPWAVFSYTGGQNYGPTHHYQPLIGSGQDVATWSFNVQGGVYEVYAWWWEESYRPPDVPFTVRHLGGKTTVRVNQQTRGGQWNLLGTFAFRGNGSVTVSDDASSGRDIVADAIRLRYVSPLPSKKRIFLPLVFR